MDGPFRPYVQRYVTILIKISDQKTKLFASWGVRDLWVPATCPAVYPLHPTTPPDRWPTSELIFSARIAEMTMDFEWKKVISKMNISGNYQYLQIWAVVEYHRCGRARYDHLCGGRSRLGCCGDSVTSLTEKSLLWSRTGGHACTATP